MEVLHLVLDSEKSLASTCFLCFEHYSNTIDINTRFEIHIQDNILTATIADMFHTLFPYEDFLLHQACDNCSDLITRSYIILIQRKLKCDLLYSILQVMDNKIDEISITPKQTGKVLINLKELSSKLHDSKLIDAVNEHSNETTFHDTSLACEICSNTFETVEHFKIHERSHKEMLKVKDCLETFQNTDKLTLRTPKKNYKMNRLHCNDCTYKTLRKSSLQAHINKHHLQTRPHVCQVCFKGFYNKSNLNEHIQTHSAQKNEMCDICGCSFLRKKNLVEHLRLHSGTRPFECSICKKKFVTSGRRSDHFKRSHMVRSECCLICNKKYSLKNDLKRHMNTVHQRM